MIVRRNGVFVGHVALQTHAVAGYLEFIAVGTWQSLQVTPAANILLCLNEP